ncbi:MAG: hypothetical protein AB7G87_13915 [Clostridia bacterium]
MSNDVLKEINIEFKEQECEGNYKFRGTWCATQGFVAAFGENARTIVALLMKSIWGIPKADYLQVAIINGEKVFIIDDISHVTVLLAHEY